MGLFGVRGKGCEREISKKSPQTCGSLAKIIVVAKTGKWLRMLHARLFRIQLPGMQIENEWLAFLAINGLQGITGEPVGEKAEIAAAGNRYCKPQQEGCGNWILKYPVRMAIGKTRRTRDSVGVVVHWKDGGIVGEAKFLEDIERPEGLFGDRIAGGTVAENGFADDVFKECFDLAGVGTKFLGSEVVNFTMPITVGANAVPLIVDGLDQLWVSFRYPADNEEGGFSLVISQQRQDSFGVVYHPLFHGVPIAWINDVLKGGNLEVVFHIDGEVVADRVHD